MIRVLVAEDSITLRNLLIKVLQSDPEIQVVGEAQDGAEAVEMTKKLRPSVVAMDVAMAGMNGLDATRRIMREAPTPVVLISGQREVRQKKAFMDALLLGALWVIERPPAPKSPSFAAAAHKIVTMIKAMAQVKVVHQWRPELLRPAISKPMTRTKYLMKPAPSVRVIAIAASTGGPAALAQMLSHLPPIFPVPILIVQHIAPGFIHGLATCLKGVSSLKVKVAEDRESLRPATVYLAPDGCHLGLLHPQAIALRNDPPVHGLRPSANILFQSVGEIFGKAAIAIVLTGMGEDGIEGLRIHRQNGGLVVAQDEASSVVFGMPGSAITAGLADLILPLSTIPGKLLQMVAHD